MAATPKHRRSASKRDKTRASNRYDILLNKFRKLTKYGGSFILKNQDGKFFTPHRVSSSNPKHKGIEIM